MTPSIFINAVNIVLSPLPPFQQPDAEAPGEYTDREKRVWRRGYEAARKPAELLNAEDLATWLESLHACGADGAVMNHKWDAAQRAAAAIRATETREYRTLGNGEPITQKQALKELADLGDGWSFPAPHDLYAKVDYDHKNQHGAYTRDETLKAGYYWTSQETPWYEGGRVVVGFNGGNVDYNLDYNRAFARAVRVSGQ